MAFLISESSAFFKKALSRIGTTTLSSLIALIIKFVPLPTPVLYTIVSSLIVIIILREAQQIRADFFKIRSRIRLSSIMEAKFKNLQDKEFSKEDTKALEVYIKSLND